MAVKKAFEIKDMPPNDAGQAHQKLYRLDPPIVKEGWGDDEPESYDYVVVSASGVPFTGPETYIFGANENGDVLSWGELGGSFRGSLDHTQALRNAGYEVEE